MPNIGKTRKNYITDADNLKMQISAKQEKKY